MDRQMLVSALAQAQADAQNHPSALLKEQYALYPDQLTEAERENARTHMASCERCRAAIEDTERHADFFRRQTSRDCD